MSIAAYRLNSGGKIALIEPNVSAAFEFKQNGNSWLNSTGYLAGRPQGSELLAISVNSSFIYRRFYFAMLTPGYSVTGIYGKIRFSKDNTVNGEIPMNLASIEAGDADTAAAEFQFRLPMSVRRHSNRVSGVGLEMPSEIAEVTPTANSRRFVAGAASLVDTAIYVCECPPTDLTVECDRIAFILDRWRPNPALSESDAAVYMMIGCHSQSFPL